MSDVATGTKSDAVEIPSDESVDGANNLADTTGNENTTFIVIGVVLLLVVFVPGIVLCVFLHRNDCGGGGDPDTDNRQPQVVEDTKYVLSCGCMFSFGCACVGVCIYANLFSFFFAGKNQAHLKLLKTVMTYFNFLLNYI